MLATLYLLQQKKWSKRLGQVVLGRWAFILQYGRAAMAVLSRSWEAIEAHWPTPPQRTRFFTEIFVLVCLGPLLQCDLRAAFDPTVTCSDASESGGAAALACSLTRCGEQFCNSLSSSSCQPLKILVLVISVFNGIGGAFRLYDVLGLVPDGRIFIDICKEANRTTRTTWPGAWEIRDILDITISEIPEMGK